MGQGVRGRSWLSFAVVIVSLVALLTSCSAASGNARDAQDVVLRLLRITSMSSYTADIDGFARAAVESRTTAELIGIDTVAGSGAPRADAIGTLTFRVVLPKDRNPPPFAPPQKDSDLGPYCFEVVFDHYGMRGDFGSGEGVTQVTCPPDASPIKPSPTEVVADNARRAAHEVLAGLPTSGLPTADEIARQVTVLLQPSPDGASLVDVTAVVDGTDVGVATGDADNCVLVARKNGQVIDVYPPSVYLKTGELGCRPSTALVDDLRPPH